MGCVCSIRLSSRESPFAVEAEHRQYPSPHATLGYHTVPCRAQGTTDSIHRFVAAARPGSPVRGMRQCVQLSVLPDEIGELTRLRTLNLSRNNLMQLPDRQRDAVVPHVHATIVDVVSDLRIRSATRLKTSFKHYRH
jgi:hypothetical protein